jgi:uncharacterized membrane protein YhaH (DUF805 family)
LDNILNKFFLISGRARRREFWMFMLWEFVVYAVLAVLCAFGAATADFLGGYFQIAMMIFCLCVIVPGFCLGVRRLHDIGLSGW